MSDPVRPASPLGTLRDLLRRLRLPWRGRADDVRPKPEPEPAADEVAAERLRAQVAVIRRAFEETGVAVAGGRGTGRPEDDADTHYLYRPGHALVRDTDLPRLEQFFATDDAELFEGRLEQVESPTRGLSLVRLPSRRDGLDDVLATIEEFEARVRAERAERTDRTEEDPDQPERAVLTPDHVLYVTLPRLCPATEPEVPARGVTGPWPPAGAPSGSVPENHRVRVAVVDTGLWTPAVGSKNSPWLEPGFVVADPEDEEAVDPDAIHPYAGHGTFVAGVISCLAPGTRVEVEGVLTHGGAVYESEICRQLDQALEEQDHPQLISISAGSHTRNAYAMMTFEMLAAAHGLDDGEKTLIIAAAGNDGSTERFWPAAFPWVTAVGSVDPDGQVSDFSNRGPWVDVYARGRDLVNAFPHGTYTCYEAPHAGQVRHFDGLAQWSGTSFATPVVTGLVAARMQATGEDAGQARDAVLAAATSGTGGSTIRVVGPLS